MPDEVAERGQDMTDDEIIEACLEIELSQDDAEFVLDVVRGHIPPDVPLL